MTGKPSLLQEKEEISQRAQHATATSGGQPEQLYMSQIIAFSVLMWEKSLSPYV